MSQHDKKILIDNKIESFCEDILNFQSPIAVEILLQDNLSSHFTVAPHWHDCFEILFVVKGSAEQTINRQKFQINENDLIIIKRGDVHSTFCEPEDDVKIMVIKFLPEFIDSIYTNSFESIYITSFLNINISPMKSLGGTPYLEPMKTISSFLLEEYLKKELSFEIAIKGYISVMISFLIRLNLLVVPNVLLKQDYVKNKSLTSMLKFIEDNALKADFDLKSAALQLNFNYSYFSRYFKKHTGKGFHEFLSYIRICEAERRMIEGDQTVTGAALETGFGNSSIFSKSYKKVRGYSPRKFIQSLH
jgi:AraC-like DNA-binding protein/mannose-6-phosphate isomerase-like protein (cupin superfamily)